MKLKSLAFCLLTAVIVTFGLGCDIIFGNNSQSGIMIDLGGISGDGSRAVGTPPFSTSAITSFIITITGPGMEKIIKEISPGTRYINMYIPAGPDRLVRVDVNMDPTYMASLNHEHMLSYAGEGILDLRPGRVSKLNLQIREGEMKPIFFNLGRAITVRMINMHPTSISDVTQWNNPGNKYSIDLDYDGAGRIYYISGNTSIYMMPQVGTPAPTTITTYLTDNRRAITVDSSNERIFTIGNVAGLGDRIAEYTNYLASPDTPTRVLSTLPSGFTPTQVTALEYDNGNLYILTNTIPPYVYRYNIASGTSIRVTDARFNDLKDVLVKGTVVYVTNHWSQSNKNTGPAIIHAYDKDTLAIVAAYDLRTSTDYDRRPGYFYGPMYFIAPSNKKIYLSDDGGMGIGRGRIVAFDEFGTWENWETLFADEIPGNTTTDYFRIYYC